ncbi:MAG: hypothetical protein U1U88_001635 [Lawsonella clevelandensis]
MVVDTLLGANFTVTVSSGTAPRSFSGVLTTVLPASRAMTW